MALSHEVVAVVGVVVVNHKASHLELCVVYSTDCLSYV